MAKRPAAGAEKLSPKLRMFLNCSTDVNAVRAEHASALRVTSKEVERRVPMRRAEGMAPVEVRRPAMPRKLRGTADAEVSVFVRLRDPALVEDPSSLRGYVSHQGDIVSAVLPLAELDRLVADQHVSYVTPGESLARPKPRVAAAPRSGPSANARPIPRTGRHRRGANVLIGIIDVEGFDFAHPEFLTGRAGNRRTRFVRIWDQGGTTRPSPRENEPRSPYDYGAELRDDVLNRAIAEASARKLPAWRLEPQSEMVEGSHGTHVAGIAAGASGFCPEAPIAAVLVSLPEEDYDRRKSFYDSTRVAHAIDYLVSLADEMDLPVSINISLGTNGHAHDASSAIDRWADHLLATPGRCISVAAGNAGQTQAVDDDDIGWVLGRVHAGGRLAARNLHTDIEWVVAGNGIADISENELEVWYSGQDRFAVSVRPPDSRKWFGPVEPLSYIENARLPDGSFFSVYNELYHPANGANYISVYLSPNLDPAVAEGVIGVRAGRWTVRLHGLEVRDGRYHAWVERDDPRPQGRVGGREAWAFPSFFSDRSFVPESTVSSFACGHRVLSVANLNEALEQINESSSQGPTRDGRNKPDVAAPGTEIVAANGFRADGERWVAMTGTSMASPYVAGVAGLMLSANRGLTAAQVAGIVQSTARPLPGHDFNWRNDAGFGVIDVEACLREAQRIGDRVEVRP